MVTVSGGVIFVALGFTSTNTIVDVMQIANELLMIVSIDAVIDTNIGIIDQGTIIDEGTIVRSTTTHCAGIRWQLVFTRQSIIDKGTIIIDVGTIVSMTTIIDEGTIVRSTTTHCAGIQWHLVFTRQSIIDKGTIIDEGTIVSMTTCCAGVTWYLLAW